MVWFVQAFETTICLPKGEIKVSYEGEELLIRSATPDYYADISIEYQNPAHTLKYRKLISRFINVLAWANRKAIYEQLATGGTCRGRVGKTHTDHAIGSLETQDLPDVSKNENRALALSLYRNALSASSLPAKVIDLMRIFEIGREQNSAKLKEWMNKQVQTIQSADWESMQVRDLSAKRRLVDLLKDQPSLDVGDYLYRTARCSSAHAASDPNDPFNPEHNERLSEDLCLIWYLVEKFIEGEIGVPSLCRKQPILPSLFDVMKLSGMLDGNCSEEKGEDSLPPENQIK